MSSTKRSVAALAGVVSALAIAAPITNASAATNAGFDVSAWASLWAGGPWSYPSGACSCYALGGTVIGSVANGGTTVVVSTGPAYGTVIGSP
jgi:hypothetical protein